jgi:hypothetical protein
MLGSTDTIHQMVKNINQITLAGSISASHYHDLQRSALGRDPIFVFLHSTVAPEKTA